MIFQKYLYISLLASSPSFWSNLYYLLFKKMPRTATCNILFAKYKVILEQFNEAKRNYEGYIESMEMCLDFKEFEDMVDWAKLADVCYLSDFLKPSVFVFTKFVNICTA